MFAPRVSLLEIRERAACDEIAAPVRRFQSQTIMTIEQEPVVSRDTRESLQIGNDHDRKLEPLRLVNRHQAHRVSRLIDLSFTLTTADRLKLLDVAHEVANQVRSGTLEARGECE